MTNRSAVLKRYSQSELGREAQRRYRNSQKAKDYRAAWKLANRDDQNRKLREYRAARPSVRIKDSLTSLLRHALRRSGQVKKNRAVELLGCSIQDFMIYMESKFQSGMSWENYGHGVDKWNIDHIIPVSLFDLSNSGHQKYCFHFSNLQPLWHTDNMKKSNKLHGSIQIGLPL